MDKICKKSIDIKNFPRLSTSEGKMQISEPVVPEERGVILGCEKTQITT